jgi:hypothetical protein
VDIDAKIRTLNENLEFIHRNLDICCQDLCEGQESKFKLEESMEILADIMENPLYIEKFTKNFPEDL